MNILVEKRIPIEEGIAALRLAKLENGGDAEIFFYQNARVRLAEFHPEELNPVALYALEKNLQMQRELREQLLTQGIDILKLSEILHLRVDEGDTVAMVPPYVEISEERLSLVANEGDRLPPEQQVLRLPLLIDGLHRALLAHELDETLSCLVVSNLPDAYPYASYPVAWDQVVVGREVPKVKKFYRRQDPYTFMRPLDSLCLLTQVAPEYGRK